jgi:hypothetical protein
LTRKGRNLDWKEKLKKGDPILPKLSTYLLELLFRKLNWSNICGFNINSRKLTNLKFAYDRVLFAKSNGEIQEMMNELTKLNTDAGLQIKAKYIKVMVNSAEIEIILNGETLECVPECTYLGKLI